MSNTAIKIPQTENPVLDVLKMRWSPRAFSEKAIDEKAIATLLEAASWAPSSMNAQPWRYIYAHKGTPAFEKMWDCLLPGNQPWVKNAAVLMLNIGYTFLDQFLVPNRHFMHDCGMANANLFTQATALDIYGHLLGGFDEAKTKLAFGLGEKEEPVCFVALGYLGEAESLEEPFRTRELAPRTRKGLSEIAQRL
ncbi:MAG: nitroreductase family protein [Schleiferiaceae bacterium]|nr:nitroreductase family protein [Schleiferiaceae bacterium]